MKKFNITKREVIFFILGLITMLIVESIYNWNDSKKAFMKGWNGYETEVKK